jgi:hypothetical protein
MWVSKDTAQFAAALSIIVNALFLLTWNRELWVIVVLAVIAGFAVIM